MYYKLEFSMFVEMRSLDVFYSVVHNVQFFANPGMSWIMLGIVNCFSV